MRSANPAQFHKLWVDWLCKLKIQKKKKSILVHYTFESRLSIKNFDFANEFNRFKGPIFLSSFFRLMGRLLGYFCNVLL